MAYYLIDYENVRVHGLDGLDNLNENDEVCIFYSENADNLTFGLHKKLNEAKARITYQKVEVGTKNALDFQLSSYLGYLIAQNGERQQVYYIVTKDNGFTVLVNYWKTQAQQVEIRIAMDCTGKNEQEEKNKLASEVQKVIKEQADVPIVVKFIQQYKTKQGINNALNKQFKDSKKTSEIYKAIKPLIADKKGK